MANLKKLAILYKLISKVKLHTFVFIVIINHPADSELIN